MHLQEPPTIPWRWVDDYKCWLANVLRAFSVASLLLAIVACGSVAAKNGKGDLMEKFDAGRQTFFGLICILLLISELELPGRWVETFVNENWPVFGPQASLVALGIAQIFVGVHLLASADEDWIKKPDGTVFKKLVLGAGSIVTLIGIINMIASWICRRRLSSDIRFTARQVRSRKHHSKHSLPRADLPFTLPDTNTMPNRSPSSVSTRSGAASIYADSKASSVFGYTLEDRVPSRSGSTRSYRVYPHIPTTLSRSPSSASQRYHAQGLGTYELKSEYMFAPSQANGYPGRSISEGYEDRDEIITMSDVRRRQRDAVTEVDVHLAVPQRAHTVAPSSVYSRSISGATRIGSGSRR